MQKVSKPTNSCSNFCFTTQNFFLNLIERRNNRVHETDADDNDDNNDNDDNDDDDDDDDNDDNDDDDDDMDNNVEHLST